MRAIVVCTFVAVALCGVASAQSACNGASGMTGPTCTADEDCCGFGTMFPRCIAKNSGNSCCIHFKAATTCNSTQTCCGSSGPGASSSAFCCNEGSTCCKSSGSGTGSASCCPTGSQCCAAGNLGFCCRADQKCNLNTLSCDDAAASTTTAASSLPAEVTTEAPPAANCRAWSSTSGATCSADEDCCGADTMFPQCIPKNSGKQCCTHFKGAATCNSTQTCCGSMGPGASSSAFCCDEGSTCCKSGGSGTGSASCCPAGSQCCGASNLGFCCRADQVCNLNTLSCDAPTGSAPSTTAAPAYSSQPAEITTAAPTTASYTTSQPAEVTTAAPTTAAPYTPSTSAPTTAAPYTTSQPAEVTTAAPTTVATTTAAPTTTAAYGSQPAEVTTQSPTAYAPSTPAPAWDSYSPAPGQASWAPVFASFAAVLLLAVVFH